MHKENHAREQYWWDRPTMEHLTPIVKGAERPLLVCCPMFGQHLHEQGIDVPCLDIDERFSDLPGFQKWDIYKAPLIDYNPDLIIIDPPFTKVRLDQLFHALRNLGGFGSRILMAHLAWRCSDIYGSLGAFGLRVSLPFKPGYVSCQPGVVFYANWKIELCPV